MTATVDDVTKKGRARADRGGAGGERTVRRAREQGLSLTGLDGLLKQLTRTALETAPDQARTFGPQIVRKRQRRLNGVDEIVLSLYARGPTTGESAP